MIVPILISIGIGLCDRTSTTAMLIQQEPNGIPSIRAAAAAESEQSETRVTGTTFRVRLRITSPLPQGNVPIDPLIDFDRVVQDATAPASDESATISADLRPAETVAAETVDPNSFQVINLVTGDVVPFARSEDFSYGNRGRLEWVAEDPAHTKFEIRFATTGERHSLQPQTRVPLIGVGDLLRYNAGIPRPLALTYPAGLVDLTGDGVPDLVGCWNYAYRPGSPWDGIVCYPGIRSSSDRPDGSFEFGDLVRFRHVEKPDSTDFRHFTGIYMWADVADFDGDQLPDIVWCAANRDQLHFYRNTGQRDPGGMPVFVEAGSVPRQTREWQMCRAVDLDQDGAMDIAIGDLWLRNAGDRNMPPDLKTAVPLNIPGVLCWFDVDLDGRLDAVIREQIAAPGLSNFRLSWRRGLGGDPPQFSAAAAIDSVNERVSHPVYAAAVIDSTRRGLLVSGYPNQTVDFFQQTGANQFLKPQQARSMSAVISLSDQAWPYLCDWDGDSDLDLLVGGGYGWLQIVINEGSAQTPQFSNPSLVTADGKPIRLTRNDLLGGDNWHDMGYPFPAYVDWDADGLPDLIVPNETNRIFWYRNQGTRSEPRFGIQQQVLCDDYPDSSAMRELSATRAADPNSNNGVYPLEPEQPFFWRTGAAFADWNGDGLMDLITHDGHTRLATLFTQYRNPQGKLRLRKERILKLSDGRSINDVIVERKSHWTESFRAVDWNSDGLFDLVYSLAGAHGGTLDGGSIYLLQNVGTAADPVFASPRTMRCFGEPIRITNHGPHPWAGDLDGDGLPDLVCCVEWSVYPFYSHNVFRMPERPNIILEEVGVSN